MINEAVISPNFEASADRWRSVDFVPGDDGGLIVRIVNFVHRERGAGRSKEIETVARHFRQNVRNFPYIQLSFSATGCRRRPRRFWLARLPWVALVRLSETRCDMGGVRVSALDPPGAFVFDGRARHRIAR
jgi:hypothetical protein